MAFDPYAIEPEAFAHYVRYFSQPGGMRAGFEPYRSFAIDIADNRRGQDEEGVPLLALAGAGSRYATRLRPMLQEVVEGVTITVIPQAGHWLAEENPEAVAHALIGFAEQEHAR